MQKLNLTRAIVLCFNFLKFELTLDVFQVPRMSRRLIVSRKFHVKRLNINPQDSEVMQRVSVRRFQSF